jgi:hypothetical protein
VLIVDGQALAAQHHSTALCRISLKWTKRPDFTVCRDGVLDKMMHMANLTLIYGMRLLPEGEVTEIHDATLKLANGHEAHVTMHVLEGSREQIETQLKQSLDAFFDFYPEI